MALHIPQSARYRRQDLLIDIHCHQKFSVCLDLFEPADEQFHCLGRLHLRKNLSQAVDQFQLGGVKQKLFFSATASAYIDCRPDPSVNKSSVKVQFAVSGTLELFEDDLVHSASGVDKGGSDDRQRAAFLYGAGSAEESLGALKRAGVDATGKNLSAVRGGGIVRACQAGDAVEQNHHILTVFDH